MKTTQLHYQSGKWINIPTKKEANPLKAQLVLVFGAGIVVGDAQVYDYVKNYFPHADIISCSTSGEILADNVYDDTAVVTAVQLEKSSVKAVLQKVSSGVNSYETGKSIMQQLEAENLASILVLSEGSFINGSELVNGLNELNTKQVPITGGLAGDAARFEKTQVGLNAPATEGNVVAIGFYGNEVKIGHSSFGGWDEFGKERIITKSDKNVLYEIDGETALDLYKQYLGPYVNELPGSALLFPLSMRLDDSGKSLVRTILTIDEDKKTMTFAGNLPEGARVRLMKANFEKIIEGSSIAAAKSVETGQKQFPELAILISCVGRKLILQDRTSEEVQAARNIFGDTTSITGFYSYGEISPFNPHTNCELHNQTMTITTFSEVQSDTL